MLHLSSLLLPQAFVVSGNSTVLQFLCICRCFSACNNERMWKRFLIWEDVNDVTELVRSSFLTMWAYVTDIYHRLHSHCRTSGCCFFFWHYNLIFNMRYSKCRIICEQMTVMSVRKESYFLVIPAFLSIPNWLSSKGWKCPKNVP